MGVLPARETARGAYMALIPAKMVIRADAELCHNPLNLIEKHGAGERIRTVDPNLGKVVL